jgi:transcriptional regulator with XRE-family HTH domain
MNHAMKEAFRESLIAHIDTYRVNVAQMARDTGVSKELIHSLRQRKTVCPNVDDAMKLAGYFGKTVEEFVGTSRDDQLKRLGALAARLSPEEQAFLEAQIATLLASKDR